MKYLISALFIILLVFLFGFRKKTSDKIAGSNEVKTATLANEKVRENEASEFVAFAKTFIGTPYLYGSANPVKGLDCSGFINTVSDHFGVKVPRSSVEFTNLGTTIEIDKAEPGDLILFTGTDTSKHVVGHIGIITGNQNGEVEFIHSSSGKAKGVTISELTGYYETRFVKVIRILPAGSAEAIG